MATELYEYRIFTKWRSRNQSIRFHWQVENNSGETPWNTARELTFQLNTNSIFLALFAQMISEEAGIKGTRCIRVQPSGGNASRVWIAGGGIQGLYLGPVGENFVSGNIRLIDESGSSSKHNLRVGPIGQGATAQDDYWFVFRLAAETFLAEAFSLGQLSNGDPFKLALLKSNGTAVLANAGVLVWPPARQINRRWEA